MCKQSCSGRLLKTTAEESTPESHRHHDNAAQKPRGSPGGYQNAVIQSVGHIVDVVLRFAAISLCQGP